MKVLVVGAGISGCFCARRLFELGHDVTIVEKGRGVGGRMSTRRMHRARIDHGAQFFTLRDKRLLEYLPEWLKCNCVAEWYAHVPKRSDLVDCSRYRGVFGMTDLAKHLSKDFKIEKNFFAQSIHWSGASWMVEDKNNSGRFLTADHLVLTLPVPQVLKLFSRSSFELQKQVMVRLRNVKYSRCFAFFGLLDRKSSVSAPGILSHPNPEIDWIADNQVKGISQVPAFTLHASDKFSDQIWDLSDQESLPLLAPIVEELMQAKILEWDTHRWRFAKPLVTFGRSHFHSADLRLSLAGDGFGGERVERAALSGLEAAESIGQ